MTEVAIPDREIVPLQDMWKDELAFSDWLAKNIGKLNEKIRSWNIETTSVQREVAVWNADIRVDLLCDATKHDSGERFKVVIENQLTGTDNDHFARLMQYATAFNAKCAVWIAPYTYYQHEQVVQWLNEITEIDVYLFTIRLVRKGDSNPEPILTPVVGPGIPAPDRRPLTRNEKINNWWSRVLPKVKEKCQEHGVGQHFATAGAWRQHGVSHHDSSVSEFIQWYIYGAPNRSTVGVYVPASPREKSHYYFDKIEKRRNEIDNAFKTVLDKPLSWERTGAGGNKYLVWYKPNRLRV